MKTRTAVLFPEAIHHYKNHSEMTFRVTLTRPHARLQTFRVYVDYDIDPAQLTKWMTDKYNLDAVYFQFPLEGTIPETQS